MMVLTIVESPFAGDVESNRAYLQRCIQDSLSRGEAPFASHQMYTDALDDEDPKERQLGMGAGFAWMAAADQVAFYADRGFSPGMIAGMENAQKLGLTVHIRILRDAAE